MSASSEINCGIDSHARPSSRVLKPPGGGHSNIFAEPDNQAPKARPKYNQQNSSNLNSCMNTTDPNEVIAKITETSEQSSSANEQQTEPSAGKSSGSSGGFFSNGIVGTSTNDGNQQNGRGRVPPGGFSSGLW